MKPILILLTLTLATATRAVPLTPSIAPAIGAGVSAANQLRAAPTITVALPAPSLQGCIPTPVTPRPVVPVARPGAAQPVSR